VPGLVDTEGELPPLGRVSLGLDQAETKAADLERSLAGHVDGETARLGALAASQINLLSGSIESRLSTLEHRAGTQTGKIVKQLNKQLGNTYNHAFPLGIIYPTNEQAFAGLAGHDIFGSMGLVNPTAPVLPAAHAPVAPASVGLTDAVGTTVSVPPLQPPTLPPPVVNPPVMPPGPGVPPLPPGPPPYQPPPTVPGTCYSYPAPPGVNAPWGVSWQGIPCSDPATCGTTLNPCSCPPGQYWGGPFIGCNDPTGGTPPAPPPPPPPPPAPAPCCQCCQCPCAGPARPDCPPGSHWEPDPTSPTLHGGGAGDGPGSPTLHGGGGGDVPFAGGPSNPTLRGGGSGPILSRQTLDPSGCGGLHPQTLPMEYTGPPQIVQGQGFWINWPWAEGAAEPPGIQAHTECLPGGLFTPPQPAPVCARLHDGFDLYTDEQGSVLIGLAGPRPGFTRAADWCGVQTVGNPTPGGGPDGPGGKCVPDAIGCRIADALVCGPQLDGKFPVVQQVEGDKCASIGEVIKALQRAEVDWGAWIGMQAAQMPANTATDQWLQAVFGSKDQVLPALLKRFGKWASETIRKATQGVNCDRAALAPIATLSGLFKFIQRWLDCLPPQLIRELDQVSNTACQSLLPGVPEADRAFLGGTISHEKWLCLVKAAGAHPTEAQEVRDAERAKLNLRQAIFSMFRERIDQARFDKLATANGVITDQDKSELVNAEQWWPNHTDLVMWMGKDALDEDAVKTFGLDKDFEQKYGEQAKKLGDGAGVSKTFMRYAWRSHWRNIGVGQMLEAYRRLRPGEVPKEIEVSEKDIRQALSQQDIQPYWVERLIATGWRVVTREDAVKMYNLHQVDEDQLTKWLQDGGYKEADALALTDYYKAQRTLTEARNSGLPTIRMAVRRYARGELASAELDTVINAYTYYPEQPDQVRQAAKLARTMQNRTNVITAAKRRYTHGLIGVADAAAELAGAGVDADEIESLLETWDQVRKRKTKEATAAMLCQWRKDQLIGAGEQFSALIRLGYSQPDAENIVADCTLKIAQAQNRGQEKAEQMHMRAAARAAKNKQKNAKASMRRKMANAPASPNGHTNGAADR
jgi:SOS response regulatory protein OraA/RecX